MEFLESLKSSFSIFPVLKGLNKIKWKNKNHLKPPKLVSQSLFKQFQQKSNIFWFFIENLTLSFPVPRWVGANTDLTLNSNISKMVRVNTAFTSVSNYMQVDRFCTCGSLVTDPWSLWNFWNLKNQVFQFFRTERVKKSR